MKKLSFFVPLLASIILFSGCGKQPTTSGSCPIISGSFACGSTSGETVSGTIDHSDLSGAITTVLSALKNLDCATLSQFVGSQGLRFSPYEHVNTGTDVVLSTQEVADGLSISRSYVWGTYDGSGLPIDLGIGQYFEKFVNDADYATAPEVTYNQNKQRGNTINNIPQIYQGKQWVEFYFSGFDAQYQGMDRKSITLVFENVSGQWYLIGIVHGARTI